jgi:hypothetical protein
MRAKSAAFAAAGHAVAEIHILFFEFMPEVMS